MSTRIPGMEHKKNAPSTSFVPRGWMPRSRSASLPAAESEPGSEILTGAGLGHRLGRVSVLPSASHTGAASLRPAVQPCPLAAGPRACPFGGACHACPTQVQAKLTVSRPDDRYEREADQLAERVMRATHPHPCTAKGLNGGSCESAPREEAGREEEEETPVMPKACDGNFGQVDHSVEQSLQRTRRAGDSLPIATRAFMEASLGHDFSDVRVHTDPLAASMNRDLDAEAFTSGNHIYFGHGRYNPGGFSGKRLLAHELVHVVQQRTAPSLARSPGFHGRAEHFQIQRFTLRGFPATEEAAMNAAVPVAISKVKSCSELSWYGKSEIPKALNFVRYDYVPDLGLCGWTFPASWYIEVGQEAFDPSHCCELASTLAHEASHTVGYTESRARTMECNCFGCSC